MRFVAGNAQHIGARPQQQDAFGFSDPDDPKFVAHGGFLGVVFGGVLTQLMSGPNNPFTFTIAP